MDFKDIKDANHCALLPINEYGSTKVHNNSAHPEEMRDQILKKG